MDEATSKKRELLMVLSNIEKETLAYPSPNSHTEPLATFQQRSNSSLILPNLRPLFAPRCAFFCSLVSLPREGPLVSLVSTSCPCRCSCPREWDVPSAASSSAAY